MAAWSEPATRQPKTGVRPVRFTYPDQHLATRVVRCVGYRGECSCGWRSRTYLRWGTALDEARDHAKGHRA